MKLKIKMMNGRDVRYKKICTSKQVLVNTHVLARVHKPLMNKLLNALTSKISDLLNFVNSILLC